MALKKRNPLETSAVQFHYIKSGLFRTVHVSGAIGSVTPSGNIHCALFNERPAIPRVTRHEIDASGQLNKDSIVVDGRDGFVREMEIDLVMSVDAARDLKDWLDLKINEAEKFASLKKKIARLSKKKGSIQ